MEKEEKIEQEVQEQKEIEQESSEEIVEPVKEEQPSAKAGDVVVIEKLNPEDKPFDADIEDKRTVLFNNYSKTKRLSNILMVAVVLIVIGAMALLMINQKWATITGYSIAGVTLLGLLVYSMLTKNRFPNQTKDYIRFVTTKIDQFVYNNTEFQDVQVDLNEKYVLSELNCDKVYKNPVDMGCRNIVKGKYLGKGFSCGELALYSAKQEGKRAQKQVAFIGKYISLANSLHFEGRYIVNIKAEEKPSDLPTDIEDLVELHNADGLVIYGLEGSDYSKDIPSKYLAALKKLNITGHLLNVNVVLWAGHTGVYLSYDDPVVALPFDKPFESEPQIAFKDNLITVLEAERIINK